MSIIGSNILAGASGQAGYNLNNSLRFRSSASGYLDRTPAGAGNRKTWTWSSWIKRGQLSTVQVLFGVGNVNTGTSFGGMYFTSTDTLIFYSPTTGGYKETTQVFRDPSAWYHLVVSYDTPNSVVKLYVNGTEITAFSTNTNPSANVDGNVNAAVLHNIGKNASTSQYYFDGYLAEVNFIDGTALTPSSFGETSTTTGSWIPKKYAGTYGTNGFYLKFADASAATAAAIGKDSSGNGNNWTPSGISVTAGTTYDAMLDVPTNTSATVANYCVMNPLAADSNATFSNANLTITSNATGEGFIPATIDFDIASSTGYYFEVTVDSGTTYCTTGFIPVSKFTGKMWTGGTYPGQSTYNPGFEIRFSDGTILQNGGSSAYGSGATAGDTWGFAIKNGKVWARNSSGWFNSGDPVTEANPAVTGQTGQWLLGYAERAGAFGAGCTYNFGQRPFAYTPPTGYVALNTYNLPTPTILQGNKYMDATLWTGNGTSQSIVNTGAFKPDFVWGKDRAQAQSHLLFDSVRGVHNFLSSNSTSAESTNNQTLTGFNSNGFQLGTNATLNQSGISFVGWQWQAGQGTTSSNTSGTITSTVSVNTTAGFSVVTYTGTGANATVGHGLGVAPKMVIIKTRNSAGWLWVVYHASVGNTGYLRLQATDATTTSSAVWQNTTPSPSVVTIGTDGALNTNTNNYVMYAWAEIAGFSKFTSYTGNGSADGPFIYCGFRPKFVMTKRTDTAGNYWVIKDTTRNTYNTADLNLYPNASDAEATSATAYVDILSNGFKVRGTSSDHNTSAATYIVMAYAENPFKNSNAR